ncbi:MAG: NADPH:quinone oxidoreductase [Betaproteobacteria bacterium RIFCSPLOWO2_12_FULL_62_13]|nr:MAG: NADPH:quinone oxidoreductase [Betaproteobacteria bacterium RIFCSPLOWO2_12_FULL_62_13]
MRAIVLHQHGPLENLVLEERPAPVPGPNEVLVDVHAAGVNFPDLMVVEGSYQLLPPRPFSPGKDLAGVVAAVGREVTTCRVGDRILAQVEWGAFAEQCVVPAPQCFVMPQKMPYEEGAAFGLVYLTAYFALVERAEFKPGDSVLVNGAAGGVGLASVQIAKALGATVLAAVDSDEKAALATENGVDRVVRTDVPDLKDALRAQVHEFTDKRGVDIVIDPVGGDVFDASLRALAWCGRLVVIGFAGGGIPEVKAGYLLVKNISVIGLQVTDYRDREPHKWRAAQAKLFEFYEHGRFRPHVMAVYPMEKFRDALSAVHERRVLGKVVIAIR